MDGRQFRDGIISALRRDLMGPLFEPGGGYPGSDPQIVEPAASFIRADDARGTFVAEDGQEVLTFPPTARYGVGVLYPSMSEQAEVALDQEQAQAAEIDDDEDASPISAMSPVIDVVPEDLIDDPLEPDEDPAGRTERQSSLAVSFVVALGTKFHASVSGATYEPFPVEIAGAPWEWWHRAPIHEIPVSFELPETTERVVLAPTTIDVGALRLQLGITAHRLEPGDQSRIVTCYIRNCSVAEDANLVAACSLFQAQLRIEIARGLLCDYRQPFDVDQSTDDEASLRLLYARRPVKAIGHGCDARTEIDEQAGIEVVVTESLPVAQVETTSVEVLDDEGIPIKIGMAALGEWSDDACKAVEAVLDGYAAWIDGQESRLGEIAPDLEIVGQRHLAACRHFLDDALEGWRLANDNSDVRDCLRWASSAMANQQLAYRAETRMLEIVAKRGVRVAGVAPGLADEKPPTWHAFQIAFVLANIAPAVDGAHVRWRDVDVVWMPTGGGKTEAYLALSAFTMLWRRIRSGGMASGTTVMMRYTLRLLTAQQLQRTASLICAMELLRRQNVERLGHERFSVGAWLGAASTPNRRSDAIVALNRYLEGNGDRPFLLTRCPWCAVDLTQKEAFGYRRQSTSQGHRVQAHCPNPDCEFNIAHTSAGLPVYEVDEDLYSKPPTFLLGTVDKFAMLAWREQARAFFGLDEVGHRQYPPPELIIQDELHLITGPLGSLIGLYEGALTKLCEHDGGRAPRVIAATATTRAYKNQVHSLFGATEVRLVPPPGLSIVDSYFSHADETAAPRAFVGVCAAGLGSFTRAEARVLASLAHATGSLADATSGAADFYWTNLVFFGSLRDLGLSKSLISTDLKGFQYSTSRATGVRSGALRPDGNRSAIRYLRDTELTSASSRSASDALARLQRPRTDPACVDIALATSVIEVGVDVPRLGMLTVVRQPKTAATYIQVAGRVGRNTADGPGLVVVLLDPRRGRDLSHYERFTAYHQRLFAAVEAASVTPFTDAVVERGLRGAISAIVRQTRPEQRAAVGANDLNIAESAAAYLVERSSLLDPKSRVADEWEIARRELAAAVEASIAWGLAGPFAGDQFLRRPEVPAPPHYPTWAAPTSLRSVDNSGGLRIDATWMPASSLPMETEEGDQEEGEEW